MKLELDLQSDESVLDAAEVNVQQFLEQLSWGEDDIYWFSLAIREMLINAIVHGNRRESGKKVHLLLESLEDGVQAVVKDEGSIRKVPEIPDAHSQENLLKPHGRGLYLARQLVDDLLLELTPSGGLKVILRKSMTQGGNHENTRRRTG